MEVVGQIWALAVHQATCNLYPCDSSSHRLSPLSLWCLPATHVPSWGDETELIIRVSTSSPISHEGCPTNQQTNTHGDHPWATSHLLSVGSRPSHTRACHRAGQEAPVWSWQAHIWPGVAMVCQVAPVWPWPSTNVGRDWCTCATLLLTMPELLKSIIVFKF